MAARILFAFFLVAACSAAQQAAADAEWPVETLVHFYGPFDLKPSTLQQVPPRMEVIFPEGLWLVGYGVEMVDTTGNRLPPELQCHTFLGTSLPEHHTHDTVVGLFSDGYTDNFRLPPGFGLFFKAGQKVYWTPMFNNRNPAVRSAAMKLTLEIIRTRNLHRSLRPLTTTFRTVKVPDLYYVAPGRDVREATFELPAGARIHAIGTHIHPYGVSIEVVNSTRKESVWKAIGRQDARGNLISMPVYSSREGYPVKAGDKFNLIAIYNNPTDRPLDAMAGIFVLYDPAPR